MSHPTLQTQIEAAEAYEALFAPALFGPWAAKVADAAAIAPGQRVLDVASGTGVLAREALARTGPGGKVAGVDPNPGMLAVARRITPTVDWREGTAEALPFPDASFDVVVSQFGLMFFGDRRQALAEMLRVLVPGGRVAVAVWNALEANPAFAAEVEIVERIAGREAAEPLRAPFILGDPGELAALAAGAGLEGVDVGADRAPARFPSLPVMIEADMRGWLPLMGVVLPEEQIQAILDEAGRVLGRYVAADGTMVFDTSAHIVTGARSPAV